MISKTLSTSERFARLHDTGGKLAEFCQVLYMLANAHADDWGCLAGDPFSVKFGVVPTSPRKLAEVEQALRILHNVGLITWYEVDGRAYIEIRGFSRHQQLKGHDTDGRKRPIPAPPENISDFELSAQNRPNAPKPALREEKRREEKKICTAASADADGRDAHPQAAAKDQELGVRAFIARFCELYSKHKHGAKYLISPRKHVPLVRRMLEVYGRARLEKLAVVMLTATADDWIVTTDRGLEVLHAKANWCDSRLAEYEARNGVIRVA